jgi:hypothetical protein
LASGFVRRRRAGANAGKLVLLAAERRRGKGREAAPLARRLELVLQNGGSAAARPPTRDSICRQETTTEGKVKKGATIVFKKQSEGATVRVEWMRNKIKGKRNLRYLNEAFDPVSAAYYVRALDLKAGMPLCFDAYSIRHMWRTSAVVKGPET